MAPLAHSSSTNGLAWITSAPALANASPTPKPSIRSLSIANLPPIHWNTRALDKNAMINGRGAATLTLTNDRPLQEDWWVDRESKWRGDEFLDGASDLLDQVLFPERKDVDGVSLLEAPAVVALINQLAGPLGAFYMSVILILSTYVQFYQSSLWRLSRVSRKLKLSTVVHKFPLLSPSSARRTSSSSTTTTIPSSSTRTMPAAAAATKKVRLDHAETLKSGLYWYGLGNVCEKDDGSSSPYFDPSRPSVIYVHGFQPRTIVRQFRESLNWKANDDQYGLDVNAADAWLKAGWNVGVFYWNQFADEPYIHDAEAKIWTNESSVGMRYRVLSGKTVKYRYFNQTASLSLNKETPVVPCVSRQLADILQQRFPAGSSAPYRLVGHSLGSQVVIHSTTLLSKEQHAGGSKHGDFRLPSNIALLDAFFTLEPKRYLGWRTVGSVLAEEVESLTTHDRIMVEQYQTSILSNAASRLLQGLTAFFELDIPHIPWYKLRARHVAAPYLYFLSFAAMMKWVEA